MKELAAGPRKKRVTRIIRRKAKGQISLRIHFKNKLVRRCREAKGKKKGQG